jgi:hypothetical protein
MPLNPTACKPLPNAWLRSCTSNPSRGGVHPRFGTRNVILPLAHERYVEVVEVLDHPSADKAPFGQAVRARSELGGGWLGWVVRVEDLADIEQRLGRAAVDGNRRMPDGREFKWRQLGVRGLQSDPQLPFFVQWDSGSPHPSDDAHTDVTIDSLEIGGDPERVKDWLGLPGRCRSDGHGIHGALGSAHDVGVAPVGDRIGRDHGVDPSSVGGPQHGSEVAGLLDPLDEQDERVGRQPQGGQRAVDRGEALRAARRGLRDRRPSRTRRATRRRSPRPPPGPPRRTRPASRWPATRHTRSGCKARGTRRASGGRPRRRARGPAPRGLRRRSARPRREPVDAAARPAP